MDAPSFSGLLIMVAVPFVLGLLPAVKLPSVVLELVPVHPVCFVTSGVRFDLDALVSSADALVMVPIFPVALLIIRGLPALLYHGFIGARETAMLLSLLIFPAQAGRCCAANERASPARRFLRRRAAPRNRTQTSLTAT